MLNIIAVVISLFTLSAIGVVLNGLCIYIIVSSKSLRKKASSLLVLNLLSIHFGQSVFVFPFYALKKLDLNVLKKLIPNGWRISYMISFYATVLSILLISVDRFLATYWLAYYKTRVTKRRIKIGLVCFWSYIICICTVPVFNQVKYEVPVKVNGTVTNKSIWVSSKYIYNPQKEWVVFMLLFNTVLPYFIIISCYVYIIYRLQSLDVLKQKYNTSSVLNKRGNLQEQRRKSLSLFKAKDLKKYEQVTRLTLLLSMMYGLLWSPSVIYYILNSMCEACFAEDWEGSHTEQVVGFIIKYLAFIDAVAAPLVYCFFHSDFRKGLLRIKSSLLKKPVPLEIANNSAETTAMV